MTYQTVAAFSQSAVLILFMLLFAGVVAYAFWPANRGKFESVARNALDLDDDDDIGGRS